MRVAGSKVMSLARRKPSANATVSVLTCTLPSGRSCKLRSTGIGAIRPTAMLTVRCWSGGVVGGVRPSSVIPPVRPLTSAAPAAKPTAFRAISRALATVPPDHETRPATAIAP